MSITRKQSVSNKLWKGTKLLNDAVISINKLNENGKQFDYVSDPKLSDVTDRINKLSNNIDWIVYQKSK